MIDLFYLLGNGSKWENNELRYSLRSVEKHFTNVGKVWIIGEIPGWLKNVVHVPYREIKDQAALNIAGKILMAAYQKDLSMEFLLMSDDYFILQDFNAADFPIFHQGHLQDQVAPLKKSNFYKGVLENTIEYLGLRELPMVDYNVHAPMRMDKQLVPIAIPKYSKPIASKSVYGNYRGTIGDLWLSQTSQITDVKIRKPIYYSEIFRYIDGLPCFSTGNRVINEAMKLVLNDLFPLKSRFEI